MSSGTVNVPIGVTIAPGRETTQVGPNNQTVSGMIFALTLPNGAVTSVFVPYATMANTAGISQLFADRIAAIEAVSALGS